MRHPGFAIQLLARSCYHEVGLCPCSENEDLEEIASADLKYLLLPALLGAMTLKQVDLSKKLEHLESARAHFWSFLKLCKSYGLGSFHLPPATSPPAEEADRSPPRRSPAAVQDKLVAMASSRQAKIERYKQKKDLENRLASMKSSVDSGQADEEQIRAFYILQTQKWINTSLEEIESVDQEIVILRSRGTVKQIKAEEGTGERVCSCLSQHAGFELFSQENKALVAQEVARLHSQQRLCRVVSGTVDLWPGAVCGQNRRLGQVLGRRDGAVHGVWILAPGLGQLMVHQGRLEGRGRWGEWSCCGCRTVPCCRQGSMGTAWGQPASATLLGARPQSLALAGVGHCPVPPSCTSWERHESSGSLNTGKVLAFGELGTVWDVPLHSAPVLHPSSWTCLGPGVPSLPPARLKAVPRAASMVQSSQDEHPPSHPSSPNCLSWVQQ
ncbi:uncharacterized protein LOC134174741 [Pezoporus occidentalis]|uniref:uncharacterized protein LOC134174741 n=1 Tax=Pezoporus occidentalis TaxID=407982 RepID=UPI002F919544